MVQRGDDVVHVSVFHNRAGQSEVARGQERAGGRVVPAPPQELLDVRLAVRTGALLSAVVFLSRLHDALVAVRGEAALHQVGVVEHLSRLII